MNIPHDVFAKKRPIRDKALKYGFEPIKNSTSGHTGEAAADALMYSSNIMNGDLTCEVVIEKDAAVTCRLIDTNTGEEYAPVNIESYTGSYVGAVREKYRKTLEQIAAECFDDLPFASDQANRISSAIEEKYGTVPEWPFKKDNGAVFRHDGSGSWFALEMYIEKKKLEGEQDADPDLMTDLLNVKIHPDKLDPLLKEKGIYRCYHMNKKLWVTLILDDTLSDERIMELISTSYSLTGSRNAASSVQRKDGEKFYWIIPSNPANYDVAKGFRDSGNDTIPWHHRIKVMPGDIVYIYQTEPVAAIMYKCEVTRSFLPRPASWRGYAPSSKYRMDLHLIEAYNKSKYPRTWMNEHGIKKTVRGQRSAPPELVRAIEQND